MKTFLKRNLQLAILPLLLFIGSNVWGQIISQYIEANSGSTPKGIEIYNNTGSTLDFSTNNLVVKKGTNGGTPSAVYTLSSGTLAPGAVIVIGTSDLQTVTTNNGATFYSKSFTFNGDDALVIEYGGTQTDVFGNPGSDPGSAWSGNGVSTKNQNIELNSGITSGSSGWTDPSTRFTTVSTNPSGTGGDDGFGIAPNNSSPTITLSPSTLSGFSYLVGSGPSTEQSFTAEGSNLTDDITITPPSDYEISTGTGGSFVATNPITLAQSGGTVNSTTIYVRLKSGLGAGSYNNEDITATSTNATDQTVTCSGDVTAPASPEPSNHATSFAATTSSTTSSSITLTWSDNDGGAQAADGFLIKASTVSYSDITAPTDGTAESDAALVKNVTHGTQTVDFTSLTASTTYYFKIWPYTNSGSDIDYKTDGSIPQASETTSASNNPTAWINEFHYDNNSTDQGEFVEVCIKDAKTYNLSDFKLYLYNGNGGTSYFDETIDNFTVGNRYDSTYVYYLNYSGIQNGAPDGIALSWNDGNSKGEVLLEFISYEGTFTGSGGPANGVTSTDVGVSEGGSTAAGTSIGRVGTNNEDSWEAGNADSKGTKNNKSGGNYEILPIQLIHFSAVQSNNGIKLKWQTATEINNDYFTIERSDDAKNFYEIGNITGAGNSNTVLDYSFVDKSEFSNTVYYRLKQTDYDGKFTYSNIISLSEENQDFVVNNIYASTSNNLVINLYSNANNNTEIQVLNTLGQVVTNKSLEVSKGTGIYNVTMPKLPQGIYFIKINTDNFSSCTKVNL